MQELQFSMNVLRIFRRKDADILVAVVEMYVNY